MPIAIAETVNIPADVEAAGAGVVYPDTVAGTTEALSQWLALPPTQRSEMGARGEQLFREQFDFASVAYGLLAMLQQQRPSHSSP